MKHSWTTYTLIRKIALDCIQYAWRLVESFFDFNRCKSTEGATDGVLQESYASELRARHWCIALNTQIISLLTKSYELHITHKIGSVKTFYRTVLGVCSQGTIPSVLAIT